MEIRTYWLSFVDPDTGKNLGVSLVDVTSEEAAEALEQRPDMYDKVDGPWVAASVKAAWRMECNPGGEVADFRVDNAKHADQLPPRNRLYSKAEIEELEKGVIE